MKYEGYVVHWSETAGHGLVKITHAPSGQSARGTLFLHWSSLPGASRHSIVHVKEFAAVRFDIVEGFKGYQAHNVEYLEDKTRLNVVEDAMIRVLEAEEYEGTDFNIRNWLCSLANVAKEEGHFISCMDDKLFYDKEEK